VVPSVTSVGMVFFLRPLHGENTGMVNHEDAGPTFSRSVRLKTRLLR